MDGHALPPLPPRRDDDEDVSAGEVLLMFLKLAAGVLVALIFLFDDFT